MHILFIFTLDVLNRDIWRGLTLGASAGGVWLLFSRLSFSVGFLLSA